MRAKMAIQTVTPMRNDTGAIFQETVTMAPVSRPDGYPSDGSDEDNSYARWSPSGSLILTIANPNLFGKFAPGQKFYLDFTPAP